MCKPNAVPVEEAVSVAVSVGLERFLNYLRETDQTYRMAVADECEANAATQDILHCMELEEHTYHETARLGRKLTAIRQERRAAKDKVLQTQPIHDWLAANQRVVNDLQHILGAMRKEEQKQANRIYVPRTDAAKLG